MLSKLQCRQGAYGHEKKGRRYWMGENGWEKMREKQQQRWINDAKNGQMEKIMVKTTSSLLLIIFA